MGKLISMINASICPKLEVLNLCKCEQFEEHDLVQIALSRQKLKVYRIEGTDYLSIGVAFKILNFMPALERFTVTPSINSCIEEMAWSILQKRFPNLILCG